MLTALPSLSHKITCQDSSRFLFQPKLRTTKILPIQNGLADALGHEGLLQVQKKYTAYSIVGIPLIKCTIYKTILALLNYIL